MTCGVVLSGRECGHIFGLDICNASLVESNIDAL